jgi:hypothetical protein
MMMGWLKDRTGGYAAGIHVMAASMIAAAVMALALRTRRQGAGAVATSEPTVPRT